MNHSPRRRAPSSLQSLLTFIIIFAQVILPAGALVAVVQPTPQLAQAVAQELGLGGWLVARAGDLAAWAQPLWGAPQAAQASALPDVSLLANNQILTTVQPEENMVVNGSFQMGPVITNATTRIPGWTVTAGNVDIYNAYTGPDGSDRELYVSGNTRGTIEQTVTGLMAGQTYFFEFGYMSEGNVAATGSVQLIDSGNVDVLNQSLNSPSDANNGGWIPFRQTFTAPADGQIKIQFIALTPATNNGIAIDDVRIARRLTNYLQNGGFDSGPVIVNATSRIPAWTVTAGNVDIYNNYFRADGSTRYLYVNGNTPGTIEQTVNGLTAGQSYSLDFEYTSENNSSTQATIKVFDSGAAELVNQTLTSTNDANVRGWQHFRATFTAPADGMAKVQFAGISAGNVGLAIDNVRIAAAPLNWVVNGDFEAGPTALNIASNAIPGWSVASGPVDIFNPSLLYGKAVDLNGTPGNGKLEQTVTGLTAGQVYAFQVNYASNGNATRYAFIRLLDSGGTALLDQRVACDHDMSYQGWCTLRYSFAAPADGTVKVVLENDETDGVTTLGIVVDNVQISRDLNFVINGNFSSGPTGLNQPFVPGWSITDYPDMHDGFSGSQYRYTIDLNGSPGSVTARQNLSGLTPGQSYTLRYMYASTADSINAQFSAQVLPTSGAALVNVNQSTGLSGLPSTNGWREARHTFTAPADGRVSILFRDIESDGNTSHGALIDNVSVFGSTTVAAGTVNICSTSAPLPITAAPGGVTDGLQFWVRADQNVFNNTNGTPATAGDQIKRWDDLSGYGLDVVPTSGREPIYRDGTAKTNYNPYLDFLNDYMANYSQIMPVYSDVTILGVGYKSATGGIDTILSTGDNGNDPTLDVTNLDFNPWSDYSSPAYVTHLASPITQNQPYIFDVRAANGVSNDLVAGLSGYDHANNMEILGASDLYMFREVNIGSDGGGENWDGGISESVIYSRKLTGVELARVRSYLAIRNGLTLDADPASATSNYDYLAADGTTVIWPGTSDVTYQPYHHDVAGIGRDDASALDQRKSTSANGDDPVTIDNSGAFGADQSFLVWGNNNSAASFATAYTPDSFTPTTPYYRMARLWRVQETGTITTVQVSLSMGADYMIVDTDGDGDFTTGTQDEVAISGGSFAYNFASGDYFTFIAPAVAPGGVAGNLTAWYKANEGAESAGNPATDGLTVDAWRDQSLNANDALQSTTTLKPEWLANNGKFNFNPSVTFVPDARLQAQFTAASWSNSNGSVYVIYNQQTAKTGWRNLIDFGLTAGDSNNPQLGMSDNDRIATWMDGFDRDNTTFQPVINETRLVGYYWQFNVGGHSYTYDGQPYTGAAAHKIGTTGIDIGNFANIGGDPQLGEYFPGQIAEIAIYKEQHDAATQARVESYFAIKYGVTLDADPASAATNFDYVNSAGVVIWAGNGANSAYHNDVTGIGRDDASELEQRKSKSVNSDDPLIIDNGAAFSADKQFLMWGNNNGGVSLSANYNGGTSNRLARVWKVQESGAVGAVNVILPRAAASSAGLRTLIVHASDPNFGTVDRTYPLTTRGGNYEVTVDFNNGDYFTFSTSSTLPEINVTPTVIDFGEVNTGDTSPAQAVTVQNLGDVSLNISNISLSGADAGQFAISGNNCGASVSAGGSCTVQLTFTPTASGNRSAFLVITSNDSDESTVNVVLTGATPGSSGGGATLNQYNLAITKSASVANATVGVPFTYTITVLNKGTITAANVVMTDQLPVGVSFGSAVPTGGGNCNQNSGTVTCTWASLAGGASATVTITVTP
ncbi:MAG: DUF642 domain-containing protein [Caldilineaceae bacterium]